MIGLGTSVWQAAVYGAATEPFVGLLDTYPAQAGYSVRRLSGTYESNLMRIREDSGDTEVDIGYDANGDLDTAAIASHCGANNGFVVTWYDQSGNGYDQEQGTAANQPQIYDGSAVEVDGNGVTTIQYDQNQWLTLNDAAADFNRPISFATRHSTELATTAQVLIGSANAGAQLQVGTVSGASADKYYMYTGSALGSGGNTIDTDAHTYMFIMGATPGSGHIREDGTEPTPFTMSGTNQMTNGFRIAARRDGTLEWRGDISEVIMWNSDQISNATAIEANLSAYYD